MAKENPAVGRRAVLAGGVGAVLGTAFSTIKVGAAGAPSQPANEPAVHGPEEIQPAACVDPGSLPSYDSVGGVPTWYEIDDAASSFLYDQAFYDRCADWVQFFTDNTPWGMPTRIDSYGTYSDRGDGCVSLHNYARAFDIAEIYTARNGDSLAMVSMRYDLWKDAPEEEFIRWRTHYWAAAGSIWHHFQWALSYYYNEAHWSHIHFDNDVSGSGYPTFGSGSSSQVQFVQAACSFVWGIPTDVDGVWGPQTEGNSGLVLERIGRPGETLDTQDTYLAFCQSTCRKGSGLEKY